MELKQKCSANITLLTVWPVYRKEPHKHMHRLSTSYIHHKGIKKRTIPFALSRQDHSCSSLFILNPL